MERLRGVPADAKHSPWLSIKLYTLVCRDFSAYGAVPLSYATYSCNLSSKIMSLTGWTNVVTFHYDGSAGVGSAHNGLCMQGCTAYTAGTSVHPICTL